MENTEPIKNFRRKPESVSEKLDKILESQELGQQQEITKKLQKEPKFPFSWRRTTNASIKKQDKVLVMFLNRLGKVEKLRLLPIVEGNMVMVKGKPYDANPKGLWAFGKARLLIIREIDRRPVGIAETSGKYVDDKEKTYETVSNEDYEEVKARGDGTDSDEFLIKAAMRAIQVPKKAQVNKGVLIFIVIAVIGGLIYFFVQGGP